MTDANRLQTLWLLNKNQLGVFLIAGGLISLLWFSKLVLFPRPSWIGSSDIEPYYFHASLAIASGQPEAPFYQPGAPVMLLGGVHLKVVQERLGHSSIAITADTYSHVTPGLQKAAAETFVKILAASDGS